MEWYYAIDDDRLGPISQERFDELINDGTITGDTLVWHANMGDWQSFATVDTPSTGMSATDEDTCCECQKSFPNDELIRIRQSLVCAECKPLLLQKIQEGVACAGQYEYAGFGIRFGAKLIDGTIQWILSFVTTALAGALSFAIAGDKVGTILLVFIQLLGMAIGVAYTTFFIGKFQATPGKMACGIIVIESEGGRVSYSRACGRYFGEIVSGITLGIGYLMVAFDDERRALHDRICKTRVIKKAK
jgi:uncharacterized RDD family membrane protein YckC